MTGEEDCPGLRKGGTLNLVRPEVELVVTASDIPESIEIDISALQIGDNLTISDVKLPAGAKPVIDRDFVIAQVSAPSALVSAGGDDDDVDADEVPTTEMGPPDGE